MTLGAQGAHVLICSLSAATNSYRVTPRRLKIPGQTINYCVLNNAANLLPVAYYHVHQIAALKQSATVLAKASFWQPRRWVALDVYEHKHEDDEDGGEQQNSPNLALAWSESTRNGGECGGWLLPAHVSLSVFIVSVATIILYCY